VVELCLLRFVMAGAEVECRGWRDGMLKVRDFGIREL